MEFAIRNALQRGRGLSKVKPLKSNNSPMNCARINSYRIISVFGVIPSGMATTWTSSIFTPCLCRKTCTPSLQCQGSISASLLIISLIANLMIKLEIYLHEKESITDANAMMAQALPSM
jgi:hypothetical protein